ncbi:MAG: DUF3089 domain-containing protein [Bacteroidaceae bacterium]|nr:DUF3089 domain-containing protein [Bacteroidaceae bacterium]
MSVENLLTALSLCAALASCNGGKTVAAADTMPSAPDYGDTTMWYIAQHDTTGQHADIFYVCSTETASHVDTATGETIHFADMSREDDRKALYGEMLGVDTLLAGACRFVAPYYRQATIDGLLADTSKFEKRLHVAAEDVEQSFRYYLAHMNQGRPFVLMGYSQGGGIVVELLKRLLAEVAERMVAAYVIGYKVTGADLACPYIKPATRADDTGVTICYNSVAMPDAAIPILSGGTAVGINPVNWRTDAMPAVLFDTLTATLDTMTHLVRVSGFRDQYNVVPYVGKAGNYHTLEIPLYAASLRANIAERVKAWWQVHSEKIR